MGTFVVLTMQTEFTHVFNTLLEGSGLLAYSTLTYVAVEVTCYHRWHFLDMIRVSLQTLQ